MHNYNANHLNSKMAALHFHIKSYNANVDPGWCVRQKVISVIRGQPSRILDSCRVNIWVMHQTWTSWLSVSRHSKRSGRYFIKIVIVSMSYFLFQFQNLTEIISAVIISKYRCINPHGINFSCNNNNRPNLKLAHKFVVCTHAQYLFCLIWPL